MNRTVVLKFDTRMIIIVGALLVMIAVALPWANLPSFVAGDLARGGVAGGGLITLGLAVLALLSLLLPWHPWNRVSLPAAIVGALVHLVALSVFVRIVQLGGNLGLELRAQPGSIGSGLFLTFAGALLMLVGGLASAAPSTSLASLTVSDRPWLGYAVWLALATALLASCLCAWGLGWLARSYTLAAPGQADISPTFAPASTGRFGDAAGGSALVAIGKCDSHACFFSLRHAHSPDTANTRDVDIVRGNADGTGRGGTHNAAKLTDAAALPYPAGYRRAHGDTHSDSNAVVHTYFYFYAIYVAAGDADRHSHADEHGDCYNDRYSDQHSNPHALISGGGKIKATSQRPPRPGSKRLDHRLPKNYSWRY